MTRASQDEAVRSLIVKLRAEHRKVTGTLVRNHLRQLTGRPGGASRIYRLLKTAELQNVTRDPTPAPRIEEIKARWRKSFKRALRAEHRERSHQEVWARELDTIKQRLAAYTVREFRPEQRAERELNVHRELHVARQRIRELEAELA